MIPLLYRENEVLLQLLGQIPSASTIARLRARGDLPVTIKVGRTRYVREEDVTAYLQRMVDKNG